MRKKNQYNLLYMTMIGWQINMVDGAHLMAKRIIFNSQEKTDITVCICYIQSNPIQSTFVKRHQSSCLFRGASQKHRGKPLLLTISALGSFTCITQHTGPTALRPIRRTKQLWLSVLLKDTIAATGNRTHILGTWVRCTRPLGHDTPHTGDAQSGDAQYQYQCMGGLHVSAHLY